MKDENGVEYKECFVGNIIGNHYWGEDKIIKSGIKQFNSNTKVYCIFKYHIDRVLVLGKPRKSFRMVEVIIRSSYIKNLRIQKVYTPRIIDFINKHTSPLNVSIHQGADYFVNQINNNHCEIKE